MELMFGSFGFDIISIVEIVSFFVAVLIALLRVHKQAKKVGNWGIAIVIGLVAAIIGHCIIGVVLHFTGIGAVIVKIPAYLITASVLAYVLASFFVSYFQPKESFVAVRNEAESNPTDREPVAHENKPDTAVSNPMMKRCPVCGREIAKTAKSCPGCGAKNKKPIYRRGWVILLVVVICIGAFIKINSASKDFILYIDETQEVKASTLSELAEIDTATYNNRYFGKPVTFTAKITGTHGRTNYTNITKTYEYSLDFGDNITVGFSEPYNFSVGDEVTVIGTLSSCVYDDVYINGALVFK